MKRSTMRCPSSAPVANQLLEMAGHPPASDPVAVAIAVATDLWGQHSGPFVAGRIAESARIGMPDGASDMQRGFAMGIALTLAAMGEVPDQGRG